MKKHITIVLATALSIGVAGYGGLCQAQSIDYGSLENLFDEPITTSATGTPQRASEASADMTIITADQIRQSGVRNIPQVLGMYVPGLNVLQEGVDAFDVGIRGYEQPYQSRLLVLIDGRHVFNDDYSRTDWANLPVNIDDIRQIEVVKGASSALFGSNASGGVINIITYSPTYDKNNTASLTGGTQSTLQGDVTATTHIDNAGGVKISAGGLDAHEFNTPRTAGDSNAGVVQPYHRYAVQSSEYKVTSDLTVMSEATFSEKKDQEAVFIDAIDPVASTSYSVRGGFSWKTPYGAIKSNTYMNHDYTDLDAGQRGQIEVADQLIVSQLEDQFKIGEDHTFRAFLEYRNKQENDEGQPFIIYERPELNENAYAIGGTWLWQIDDKWSLTNALRTDHTETSMSGVLEPATVYPYSAYSQAYNTVAANSALVFKVTNDDTLRTTYGRGISNPSLVDTGFNLPIVTGAHSVIDYEGNPYLKPTVVNNYGLTYEHKLADIASALKFSTYYEDNEDLIAYVVNAPRSSGGVTYVLKSPVNVGESQGVGGELGLSGKLSGFRWDGSYSYQTASDAAFVAQTLNYGKSSPEHQFRLNLGYTINRWEADVHGQIASSTDLLRYVTTAAVPTATNGYYSMGARLGYAISDHATVALSGTNLTRATTEESPYPTVERQVLVTVTGKF